MKKMIIILVVVFLSFGGYFAKKYINEQNEKEVFYTAQNKLFDIENQEIKEITKIEKQINLLDNVGVENFHPKNNNEKKRNYMNKLQKTISKYTDKKYKILDSFGSKLNATHSNELLNFIIKSTNQSQEIFHRNM